MFALVPTVRVRGREVVRRQLGVEGGQVDELDNLYFSQKPNKK